MADGLRRFKEDFRSSGWQSFVQYAEKQNNQLGQTIVVAEEAAKIESKEAAKEWRRSLPEKSIWLKNVISLRCQKDRHLAGRDEIGEVFKTAE